MFRSMTSLRSMISLCGLFAGFALLPAPSHAHGLLCDMEYPEGYGFEDNFSFLGDQIMIDDECGMNVPLVTDPRQEGQSRISLEIGSIPYRMSYDLYLKTADLEVSEESRIVVMEMTQNNSQATPSFLELRLLGDNRIQAKVQTDNGVIASSPFSISTSGAVITVDVIRSYDRNDASGQVTLLMNGREETRLTGLRLLQHLPTAVHMGLIRRLAQTGSPWSAEPQGELRFQPMGAFHQMFP